MTRGVVRIACADFCEAQAQTILFDRDGHRIVSATAVPRDCAIGVVVPGSAVGRVTAPTLGRVGVDPMAALGLEGPPTVVLHQIEAAALGEWVLRGRLDRRLVYVEINDQMGGVTLADGAVVATDLFRGGRYDAAGHATLPVAGRWPSDGGGSLHVDADRVRATASMIARNIAAEASAASGVLVVAGSLMTRHPQLAELVGAELAERPVFGPSAPPGVRSAAAWGVRECIVSSAASTLDNLDVIVHRDAGSCAMSAADAIEHAVLRLPHLVLGVATGSTPMATYLELARRRVDLSRAHIFLLDEYVGLPPDDRRSYRATITHLFGELGVPAAQVHAPDVHASDLVRASHEYEAEMRARGGVALQILGIGRNGHIGFNEPGSQRDTRTRLVELSEATRADNARFFTSVSSVPRLAITQGIGTILDAGELLLLATGDAKQRALTATLAGPISSAVPASAIRDHPRATVIADSRAAAGFMSACEGSHRGAGRPRSSSSSAVGRAHRSSDPAFISAPTPPSG